MMCIILPMSKQKQETLLLLTLAVISLAFLVSCTSAEGDGSHVADSDMPPIRTDVKFMEPKEKKSDDPDNAWEEWGETEQSRQNPFPKRQRKIEVGMDIHTIMGMAMRQPKVVVAVLRPEFGATEQIGNMVTAKFKNQMAAAGIGCRLWFVLQGRQVVANCETIRDGHMAKDYMITQHEIMRTVLDNIPFTPKPTPKDDDDDDDNDDDDDDDDDGPDARKVTKDEPVDNKQVQNTSADDNVIGDKEDL